MSVLTLKETISKGTRLTKNVFVCLGVYHERRHFHQSLRASVSRGTVTWTEVCVKLCDILLDIESKHILLLSTN